MEKINILMPTYNGRLYLRKQLDSILNQTFKDFRLIISDDASTDSTLKILKEYEEKDSRIEVYGHQKNMGLSNNIEFLIGKVRSEFFMFADQDDVWELDKIEKTFNKLQETNSDLVFTDLEVTNSRLKTIAPSYWKLKGFENKIKKYNNFESLYLNNFITGCTMLVKSKWINDFLPIPKTSKYILYDYWISLVISQNGKMAYIDSPTIKYRQHKKNQVGSKMKSEELNSLDEIRNLFIDVKIDHFKTFIVNENIFKNKEIIKLNHEALNYFEKLKEVKKINFSSWSLFFRLYKYEDFSYKMKNFLILNLPMFARICYKFVKKENKEV